MQLNPGTRLRSQVCNTEVIVVKGGVVSEDLTCGGLPMTSTPSGTAAKPKAGLDTGSLMGKRYGNGSVEVLVTRAGEGTIALGDVPLEAQGARLLPSSD